MSNIYTTTIATNAKGGWKKNRERWSLFKTITLTIAKRSAIKNTTIKGER